MEGKRRAARIAALGSVVALCVTAAGPAPALGAGKDARVGGRAPDRTTVLVRTRGGADVRAVAARAGGAHAGRVAGTRFHRVNVPAGAAPAILRRLRASDDVAAAQRDHVRTASLDANDPLFAKGRQAFLSTIRLPAAWDLQLAGEGDRIAVLDTGVDADHPDLAGRVLPGRDVVDGDDDAGDEHGHGTIVAGTAAAGTGNDLGIAGVASGARVLPVRVLGADGSGTDADVAEGIAWAADHGADVINLSLGGPAPSEVLADAVAYAQGKDVVVVAAAGNRAIRVAEYPAALPGVVAVTATDWGGEFHSRSNTGDWVDVAAPGWRMISTAARAGAREGYETSTGTSLAAPVVAGVAALVRARHPSWSRTQVEARIRDSARDLGPRGIDPYFGHGLVDAAAALGATPAPAQVLPAGDTDGTPDRARVMELLAGEYGEISPQGDVDWWAFDVPHPGRWIVGVEPRYPSRPRPDAMDVTWELYAPDQRFMARADVWGLDLQESEEIHFPAAGRYLLKVENLRGSRTPGPQTYNVAVERRDGGSAPPANPFVPQYGFGIPTNSRELAVTDLTADGLADVLVVTTTRGVGNESEADFALHLHEQTSEGWLQRPVAQQPTGAHDGDAYLATGDVTGDGRVDAVVATPAGVRVFPQAAGGGLGAGELVAGTAHAAHVRVADADGDGDRDIVYARAPDAPAPPGVFAVAVEGSARAAPRRLTAVPVRDGFAIGHLNGDGRPDLAVDTGPFAGGEVQVLRQAADGTYVAQVLPHRASDLAIGDLTGDGRLDLVLAGDDFADRDVLVFAQGADGSLGTLTNRVDDDNTFQLALGDADADGDADLAAGGHVYLQRPGGVLEPMEDAQVENHSPYNGDIAIADLNDDGLGDVVSTNRDGLRPALQRSAAWPRPVWVRNSSPAPGSQFAATSTTPTLRFGHALDPASITPATVALVDATTGAAVAATRSYDPAARTVTVRPSAALQAGRTYTVTVAGVRDTDGHVMGLDQGLTRYEDGEVYLTDWMVVEPFELRFTVARAASDTTPPDTRLVSGPKGNHRDGFHTWQWTSNEQRGTFECSLDDSPYTDCHHDLRYGYVDDGTHTFRVRARDPSGNVDPSPATRTWHVDWTHRYERPPNAEPGTATTISGASGSLTGTILGRYEPGGWSVGTPNPGGESHWYRWTAPATGAATFHTEGSGFDTLLGVITGEPTYTGQVPVADDDDGGSGLTSRLSFTARAGQTYWIGVDGANDTYDDVWSASHDGFIANGAFTLTWSVQPTAVPVVVTGSGGAADERTASVSGQVDPNGSATTYRFEYGTTTAYGSQTAATSAGSGAGLVPATAALTGLQRGTTYHYRLAATNAHGTTRGEDRTFTTPARPPLAETGNPVAEAGGGRLAGTVNPRGAATQYHFQWGPTDGYGNATPVTSAGAGHDDVEVSATLPDLPPSTSYHVRLVATNDAGTTYGDDRQLIVPGTVPAVTGGAVGDFNASAAQLRARVDPRGQQTTVSFQYGTTTAYGDTTGTTVLGADAYPTDLETTVSGLQPATTYHARAVATNASGTTNGADFTFTTRHLPPEADTGAATAVGAESATLHGVADGHGLAAATWFEYGTNAPHTATTPESVLEAAAGAAARSATVTGLAPNTTYYARLVVETGEGRAHGGDVTFKTLAAPPSASDAGAEDVGVTGATVTATVDPRGSATTARFEYGRTSDYGATTPAADVGEGHGPVALSAALTGLEEDAEYHVRVVATNAAGTVRGADVVFRTGRTPPDEPQTPQPPPDDPGTGDTRPPPSTVTPPLDLPRPPPAGPPAPPSRGDRRAPSLWAALERGQTTSMILRRGIRLRVGADEACVVRWRAGAAGGVGSGRGRLVPRRSRTIAVRLPARAAAAIRRGRTITLRIALEASDAAGNRATLRHRVTVRGPRAR